MLTPFGKEIRKYRIDLEVSLKDMAERLGVTSAFLSALESGKKPIPEPFIGKVAAFFDIKDFKHLKELAEASQPKLTIGLVGKNAKAREVAAVFARSFDTMSEKELDTLLKSLKK